MKPVLEMQAFLAPPHNHYTTMVEFPNTNVQNAVGTPTASSL